MNSDKKKDDKGPYSKSGPLEASDLLNYYRQQAEYCERMAEETRDQSTRD